MRLHILCLLLVAIALPIAAQNGAARIDGVVLDASANRPLPSVSVRIGEAQTITNREGRFTLENLPPGSHLLVAERDGYMRAGRDSRPLSNNSGVVLSVRAGEHVKDLVLQTVATGAVSGAVYDAAGKPVQGAAVYPYRYTYDDFGMRTLARIPVSTSGGQCALGEIEASFMNIAGDTTSRIRPGIANDRGMFRIYNLDPGQYAFCVSIPNPRVLFYYPGSPSARNAPLVEVKSGADVQLNAVILSNEVLAPSGGGGARGAPQAPPGFTDLRGRVVLATSPDATAPIAGVMPWFRYDDGSFLKPVSTAVGVLGPARVRSGLLQLKLVTGFPAGKCFRSLKQGDRDVLSAGLMVDGPTSSYDVVVGDSEATVQGTVSASRGQRPSGVTVVLVPDDKSRFELYSVTTTDQNGAFRIPCASTGGYRLYAWHDMEGAAYRNEEFMQPYVEKGAPVNVVAGRTFDVNLQVLEP